MTDKSINGFIIQPPVSDAAWFGYAYRTFGITAYETWANHCHVHQKDMYYDHPDLSRQIQRWHDRGYRLREAILTIPPKTEDNEANHGKSPSSPGLLERVNSE